MKILTTTEKKVYSREFGWLNEIKVYINLYFFQIHIWTENHLHRPFESDKADIISDQIADMYEYDFYHNNKNH